MKKSILIIIGLLLLSSGCIWLGSYLKANKIETRLGKTDTIRIPDFVGSKQWQDRYNQEHERNESVIVESDNLKTQNKQLNQKLSARAANLQVKQEQIESLTDLLAQARLHITTRLDTVTIRGKDGEVVSAPFFDWNDKYDTVSGYIIPGDNLINEVHLDINIIAPIKTTVIHKGNWVRSTLGLTKDFVDGTCDNHNVHITGINHTEIETNKTLTFIKGIGAGVAAAIILNIHRGK